MCFRENIDHPKNTFVKKDNLYVSWRSPNPNPNPDPNSHTDINVNTNISIIFNPKHRRTTTPSRPSINIAIEQMIGSGCGYE